MKTLLALLSNFLPWEWRRRFLVRQFGYELHPTARLGLAWILPARLIMEEHSSIGHLTVARNLDLVHLQAHATIGRGNWITGFPFGGSRHFASETDRRPELIVGAHAAITNRHLIDCTGRVTIGAYTTIAGFQSQFISHGIDIAQNRQASQPINIGAYCFVGTNCVMLAGSALPDYCVLGAKSLLNKAHTERYRLYGGVPARELSTLSPDCGYFTRREGFVY
ncbi:MAG: acyltransferase [Verrucomicrobiota bacterium]|nr:acyltransferase [Verrucomicrobiota bacterium]